MRIEEIKLPDLNCGVCGYRSCSEFSNGLKVNPQLIERCIHLTPENTEENISKHSCKGSPQRGDLTWKDSLDRDIDFYLEHFPEDPGPREIIIPHNPMITRELEVKKGDILIGRPLGMSCGCPITHCGIAMDVEPRTGVIVWCVTGPLNPRQGNYKDLGYYIAEGYEGMVKNTRTEIKIGMRYFFQPLMCMLQWRHSGLVNFINKTPNGFQIRLEGLWIG